MHSPFNTLFTLKSRMVD